jgi:hypothetical protein
MRSDEILAAAHRFKASLDALMARAAEGLATARSDVIEMHEAVLGLIRATDTGSLEEALDVLNDSEAE